MRHMEASLSPSEVAPQEKNEGWRGRVVYQVYPNTFHEARRDGEAHTGRGSILGVTEKLPYLKELGIGVIWLSPFYESPMVDGGYDISDYEAVDSGLGTVEDVEELVEQAHELDIKVICDLVPNHTSNQHEWFQQSLNDPEGEYGDFYIWKDPKEILPGESDMPHNIVGADRLEGLPDGYTVPNNWSSIFSLPELEELRKLYDEEIPGDVEVSARTAWTWSTQRQQFYLAEFAKEQPSLNWQNPNVRQKIEGAMQFWLDKGIDGFRVDVVNHIGKDPEFRDEEPVPAGEYDKHRDNPHDQWKQERLVSYWDTLKGHVQQLIGVLDNYPGTRLVLEDWMTALSGGEDRLSKLRPDKAVVFNFKRLLQTNSEGWDAQVHKKLLDTYYSIAEFVEWGNQVDSNHDVDRVVTRLGERAARAAALTKLALPGNPYIFQGEEGGFPNNEFIPADRRKDDENGLRDGERAPIMWNAGENAGFSQAPEEQLWLPVDPRYPELNLADQMRDPRSSYSLYRSAISARNQTPELRKGGHNPMETDHTNTLAFGRSLQEEREQWLAAANFSGEYAEVAIHRSRQGLARVALSSIEGPASERIGEEIQVATEPVLLRPHEVVWLRST